MSLQTLSSSRERGPEMRRIWNPIHRLFTHYRLCPGIVVRRFKGDREDKAAFYAEGVELARQRQQDVRRREAIQAEIRARGAK